MPPGIMFEDIAYRSALLFVSCTQVHTARFKGGDPALLSPGGYPGSAPFQIPGNLKCFLIGQYKINQFDVQLFGTSNVAIGTLPQALVRTISNEDFYFWSDLES